MPHIFVGGDVFAPSAMTKNSTGTMGAYNTWTAVDGWIADTVGYPGSQVSGNGLVVQSGGAAVPLTANVVVSGALTTGNFQARLLVGTTVVATGAAVSGTGGTLVVSATVPLVAGSVVTVETWHTIQSSAWEATITAGAATFLRIG
ncbi:hypothetical protein [Nocardia sp. NPDC058497]|uniref:hypothetical protein n=1 Tax=Nocardia sp. NPDC058497 TaxID=3346529 RepID=UPI003650D247